MTTIIFEVTRLYEDIFFTFFQVKAELQSAKKDYEALNAQLLEDLPLFYDKTVSLVKDCILNFAQAKRTFHAVILGEYTNLMLVLYNSLLLNYYADNTILLFRVLLLNVIIFSKVGLLLGEMTVWLISIYRCR